MAVRMGVKCSSDARGCKVQATSSTRVNAETTQLKVCPFPPFIISFGSDMQLVMHNLWVAFVSNPGLFLGSVLVGLLIVYAATLWLGTLQRLNFQRQQRSLER